MKTPKVSRPHFPKGYVDHPKSTVTWDYVAQRLVESKNYWLCSVRPNGHPHVIPRWGVYIDDKFYYDGSPETRHAQNIVENPHISLHLESGDEVIISEGTSKPAGRPSPELAIKIAEAYRSKYALMGYAPKADQWNDGGLYEFTPRKVLAWTSFTEDPTKFEFE
jgi:pyridoxamine 5'-phosphate oxidase-like protein